VQHWATKLQTPLVRYADTDNAQRIIDGRVDSAILETTEKNVNGIVIFQMVRMENSIDERL
jgi:hypothetical protein